MDAELKAKWISALRSGYYEQGVGRLRTSSNTYCCLGVLCDIINPEGWSDKPRGWSGIEIYWTDSTGEEEDFGLTKATAFATLGAFHMNGSEFANSSGALEGVYERCGSTVSLASLNDEGFTFDQIADIVDYFF